MSTGRRYLLLVLVAIFPASAPAQPSKTLPKGRNGETAALRARLKQLQNWNDKARALLPIAKTFLKLGAG